MSIIAKSLISLGTLGTIGGIGAYAGGLFNSKEEKQGQPKIVTISKKLTEEGFEVLDTTKNDGWQAVLDEYKQATERSFTKQKEENKTIEQLRSDCSRIINTDSKTDANYSLAKQWCVKKEKMETILGRLNLKLLKVDPPEYPLERPIWIERITKLKQNKQKFSAVTINEQTGQEAQNISAFKTGCKNLNTPALFTTSDGFVKNFELAKEWCSTNK